MDTFQWDDVSGSGDDDGGGGGDEGSGDDGGDDDGGGDDIVMPYPDLHVWTHCTPESTQSPSFGWRSAAYVSEWVRARMGQREWVKLMRSECLVSETKNFGSR